MNVAPGTDTFEVWFVPAVGASLRLSAPLHIGQPLAAQDDALDLAEVAAAELPAYGFPRGEVRITWNAAVVQALQTVPCPSGHGAPAFTRESRTPPCAADSQREVARMALEDLRQQVSRARPDQAAPAAWLACLDQALRVMASPEEQRRYGLDGQTCVTVETLHERVVAVLHRFAEPGAHEALSPAVTAEPALSV